MNAGTFTPITAGSGYGTSKTSGSSSGQARQTDSASFMDVFARNLQDGGKALDTKAPAGRQKETSVSKTANGEKTQGSHESAVQEHKPVTSEDSRKPEDGKTADESMETGEGKDVREGKNTQNHPDNSLNLEEGMNLQTMMALWQNGFTDIDIQPEDQQKIRAVVQTELAVQPGNQEQMADSLPAQVSGQEEQKTAADQSLVQNVVSGMDRVTEQDTKVQEKTDGAKVFVGSIKEADADKTSVRVEMMSQAETLTQQSGEESLTDTQGRDLFRVMSREQTGAADEEPKEANQVLEELKRNAQAKGLDFTDRIVHNRINGSQAVDGSVKGQEVNTPVLEQLRAGLEHGVKTGMKEMTIHLKPEGLGDIVIHLANAGEKMTVRIGVTNPDTEKLVTSQMESLKDMLRPLNAEVAEVYRDSQGAMDFAGYNQQMQEHRGQQTHSHYRYYGDDGNGTSEDDFLMEAERMMAESRMSRLYAYV